MAAGGGTKAIVAALVANGAIAVGKFVGFAFTRSSSMLAEGVHSVADTGNQALLLLGSKQAQREANERHPFGFGRERYFWSFVVAVVLFSLGGAFATFEGIEKIRHPHEIDSLGWAVGILSLAIVAESMSFRTAIVEARPLRGDQSWWEFVRHSRTPELPVVLLEDLGALVGLVLALAGVALSQITDDPVWDGIGTLSIGILLGVIAVVLAVEMKSLLIGESARSHVVDAIRAAIEAGDDVVRLVHLRTQHIGPDELLVAAKVEFRGELTARDVSARIDALEAEIRGQVPAARMIYIEPGLAG